LEYSKNVFYKDGQDIEAYLNAGNKFELSLEEFQGEFGLRFLEAKVKFQWGKTLFMCMILATDGEIQRQVF